MDSVFERIGEFGLHQRLIFLQTCICSFMNGPPVVITVFSEAINSHRCFVPSCDDEGSGYKEDYVNFTIPFNEEGNPDTCKMYYSTQERNGCTIDAYDQDSIIECQKWVFDRSDFTHTAVTQFGLVCNQAWLVPLSTTIYMVGMLVGSMTMGYVADIIGRRRGLLICILTFSFSGLGQALSPNYPTYLVFRFFTAIGGVSMFCTAFVMAMEFVGIGWRTFCGMMIEIPFALGEASVGVIAYFIKDFRYLIGGFHLTCLLLVSYYWTMPESIRWLMAKGRKEEAVKIIQKAAKVNDLQVPKAVEIEADLASSDDKVNKMGENASLINLISLPNMRKRTLIQFYCWTVCTLAYFGISLSSRNLSGNIYINYIAAMLIEIPGVLLIYAAMDRIGRKGSICFFYIVCGISCITAGFLPQDLDGLIITMNLIGKFGISGAFGGLLVFTAEIFPTSYRAFGVGSCSTFARIGGIVAPFIASLSSVFLQLPILIFGISSLIAGIAILFLPETLGVELQQTLAQSESFGSDQKWWYFSCCAPKNQGLLNR